MGELAYGPQKVKIRPCAHHTLSCDLHHMEVIHEIKNWGMTITFLFSFHAFIHLEMCIIKNRNPGVLTHGDQSEHASF